MPPFSLYIHVPYCIHKCPYCDFNTYAVPSVPEEPYRKALLAELECFARSGSFVGRKIQSIYFGGGTPSLLSPKTIQEIIDKASSLYGVLAGAEITLEANPERVSLELLKGFREAGVSRVSFGSQSLQPRILKLLGRAHTPEDIINAASLSRRAGIDNFNLDLIFGVPDQNLEELQRDLDSYCALDPNHISAYGLTVERGTPFYQDVARGIMKTIPDEESAEMMEVIIDTFEAASLNQYEISNFAKIGFESKHNQSYWNRDDYLGIGAGAHSYLAKREGDRISSAERWSNLARPEQYMESAISKGESASWRESLEIGALKYEFFFLGLRRMSGVNENEWESAFGEKAFGIYNEKIFELITEGFLKREDRSIALTRAGLLLADSLFERLAG